MWEKWWTNMWKTCLEKYLFHNIKPFSLKHLYLRVFWVNSFLITYLILNNRNICSVKHKAKQYLKYQTPRVRWMRRKSTMECTCCLVLSPAVASFQACRLFLKNPMLHEMHFKDIWYQTCNVRRLIINEKCK